MQKKLTGYKYKAYWQRRAKNIGMSYVGKYSNTLPEAAQQASLLWNAIQPVLPGNKNIRNVLEFGCGWGRILHRLALHYPDAKVRGIDFVRESILIGRCIYPECEFHEGDSVPSDLPKSDLIVTCTCLQHIVDNDSWSKAVDSLQGNANPGCRFVFLEWMERSHMKHMADRRSDDVCQAFNRVRFTHATKATHEHWLLCGVLHANPPR